MSTNNGLEWLSDRPKVHYGDCWKEHHDCAIKEIKRLQEELEHMRDVFSKYDIIVADDNAVKVSKKK